MSPSPQGKSTFGKTKKGKKKYLPSNIRKIGEPVNTGVNPKQTYGTREEQLAQQRGEMPLPEPKKTPRADNIIFRKDAAGNLADVRYKGELLNPIQYQQLQEAQKTGVTNMPDEKVKSLVSPNLLSRENITQNNQMENITTVGALSEREADFQRVNANFVNSLPEADRKFYEDKTKGLTTARDVIPSVHAAFKNTIAKLITLEGIPQINKFTKFLAFGSSSNKVQKDFDKADELITSYITTLKSGGQVDINDLKYQLNTVSETLRRMDELSKGKDKTDLNWWKDYGLDIHQRADLMNNRINGIYSELNNLGV